jgi:hypothetical protein
MRFCPAENEALLEILERNFTQHTKFFLMLLLLNLREETTFLRVTWEPFTKYYSTKALKLVLSLRGFLTEDVFYE